MNHKLDPIGHKTRHEEYASLHPTRDYYRGDRVYVAQQ
ncbi:hypothetical protein PPTG_21246 [Phytophthora nicotianae INRA-310]|uniref:Uncharacterized protein n=1 Tax=Phytophthora nicotianae (strain INRA-310) TaxID=761204 RepID=W2R4J5_PHYN3|nr:hypothetical protein PPTG_21246 [Phytophthora nicotianae INRA-310]ETN20186.1 hypothetical protein PPTG_21246 [Phytophthora nicotianae INRA-310]